MRRGLASSTFMLRLLPRWRGAAPIQGALLAGDEVTGVTIIKLDEGLDTGPMLAARETPIDPNETAGELESRLARLGADLLMGVLPAYLSGQIEPQPQPEEGVTMTRTFRKSQALIDWAASAEEGHNHIRAFSPDPGAYTFWEGVRLKILRSRIVEPDDVLRSETEGDAPGTVSLWEGLPVVATGEGHLALVYLQMAGKRPMDGGAFVRGRQDFIGTVLGSEQPGE